MTVGSSQASLMTRLAPQQLTLNTPLADQRADKRIMR
jgi:hypothetical protein